MYKTKLVQDIDNRMQQFFQEEYGNRITANNWSYFGLTIKTLFEKNKMKEEETEIEQRTDHGN